MFSYLVCTWSRSVAFRSHGSGGGRYYGTGGYRGGSGGGGGGSITLSLPPFVGAVKKLIIINTCVFFGLLILGLITPSLYRGIIEWTGLVPDYVVHGMLWQLVTYSFLHLGFWHIFGNMLQLWFFGSTMESHWGTKQFYEFYFFTVIGAAITTIIVSYTGILGVTPGTLTVGASGGVFGVLLAYAYYYGDNNIFLLFPPISIRAKYLVAILILINLAGTLGAFGRGSSVAYSAHIGGALFGWIYVRFLPRRGLGFATSEGYYSVRNAYYRWKRRRAGKKFEVYMRKHDRSEYFDEHGNYKAPDDKDKQNGGSDRGGWVN
jgi:membrane associated rhomboid family serine protease